MEPRPSPFNPGIDRDRLRPWTRLPARPIQPPPRDRYWLHVLLFLLTLASTTFTGGMFISRGAAYLESPLLLGLLPAALVADGLRFALSLLGFLTVHEFGHYFAARHHRIATSLPYYLPTPLLGFGTLGAVIRIREPIPTIRKLFDVGAAGPLAGFVVAIGLLLVGLFTLPPPLEYAQTFGGHEDVLAYIQQHGQYPAEMGEPEPNSIAIIPGNTLLYAFLTQFFPRVPPMYELLHYPILFAGWLGLFFTALNLLPVGQLDGGHILYALVGREWHGRLARGFAVLLLASGAIGFVYVESLIFPWTDFDLMAGPREWILLPGILYFLLARALDKDLRLVLPTLAGICGVAALSRFVFPALEEVGYAGWFIFGLLIVLLVKVDHPPVLYHEPLTPARRALGILCILIFFLCFSIRPLHIIEGA